MKVVLVRPPEINRVWVGIPKFFNEGIFLFPPLGIMQLKSYIEKYTSYEVIIYDSLMHRANYEKVAKFIKKISAQVIGISTFTHSLIDVVKTAWAIKKINPSVHIIVGGPHTYAFSEESNYLLDLEYIDAIVLGEGETAFKEILCALDKGEGLEKIDGIKYRDITGRIITNGKPVFISNLDSLPFPSRNIYGFKRYYTPSSSGVLMTTMITSRGCPYNCKFCNVLRKYRSRSIKNIVDEMELCRHSGFNEIFFIDDTFNVTTERVVQLSEEILSRGLKIKWGFKARCDNVDKEMLNVARKAGCFRIQYGVETGSSSGLSLINKRLTLDIIRAAFKETKKAGIRTTAYFIIGCPHERIKSDVLETINFAKSLPTDFAVFSLFSPYPDTVFYREGVEKKLFNTQAWQNFMQKPTMQHDLPTCWQEHFSRVGLIKFLKIAYRKFYYRPRILLNAFCDANSLTEIKRILFGSLSLLKLEFLKGSEAKL